MTASVCIRRSWAAIAVVGLSTGCVTPDSGPQPAFLSYRRAVAAGDTDKVAGLHSRRRTDLRDPARLAALRESHPELWAAIQKRLQGDITDVRIVSEIRLASGKTVRLVQEGESWRMDAGALWWPGGTTPEDALRTLAYGIAHNDLAAIRLIMPEAQQPLFATDAALEAHIARIRSRVDRALARVGPLRSDIAQIRGKEARIVYTGPREVRFVLESNRWRVLDVE